MTALTTSGIAIDAKAPKEIHSLEHNQVQWPIDPHTTKPLCLCSGALTYMGLAQREGGNARQHFLYALLSMHIFHNALPKQTKYAVYYSFK